MHTFHVQEFFIIIVQYMVRPTIGDFTLGRHTLHKIFRVFNGKGHRRKFFNDENFTIYGSLYL